MRAFALAAFAALGLVSFIPATVTAAELDVPTRSCARGQYWDGYRCTWPAPRATQVQPQYGAQVYEEDEYDDPVYVAPRVYAEAPVYAVPYYRPPVVSYYAYSGPRYRWGYGYGGHHHRRWH